MSDLVIERILCRLKLRTGGLSPNLALHRFFWDRSPTWRKIRAEEAATEEDAPEANDPSVEAELDQEHGDDDAEESDIEEAQQEAKKHHFDPIDARFLSSAPLVRSRVIKLLKHSQNQIHVYKNTLLAIVSECFALAVLV